MSGSRKTPKATFKGKTIRRVLGGYQIVGDSKVFKTLLAATDSIK